jgi:hypothetical protein
MTPDAHNAAMRIGFYMAQQVEGLSEIDKLDVWAEVARWCEGDIDASDYERDEDWNWVRKRDEDDD